MKFDVITGNPMIAKIKNGEYMVVYADPSDNWKISEYKGLTLEEVSELPFVDKNALIFLA